MKMTIKHTLFLFSFYASILIFSSCSSSKVNTEATNNNNQTLFWNQLKSNCGKSFRGIAVEVPELDTTFRGKELTIHIRSCEENRIRIPFFVGKDRSRTFILRRFHNKLEWKHDHRHEDGEPDKMTMYGGSTTNSGSANKQFFPADEQSIQLRGGIMHNVWWVEIDPGKSLTYNLNFMGSKMRYVFKFDLTKEVETPPAPWGWKE